MGPPWHGVWHSRQRRRDPNDDDPNENEDDIDPKWLAIAASDDVVWPRDKWFPFDNFEWCKYFEVDRYYR